MKTFTQYIEEKMKSDHAVFAYGRFQPPTTGHEKLIKKVEDEAQRVGGTAHIVASHSEGTGKNPIPKEKKVELIKKITSPTTEVSHSTSEEPTLLHQLSRLHRKGVRHITMVAGSDRVEEYRNLINKYNGKKGTHGHFNFKSVNVVSAGHRDPDSEGTEGISGTEIRRRARAGDIEGMKKGLPKALHPHAKEIADHIKAINEEFENEDQLDYNYVN